MKSSENPNSNLFFLEEDERRKELSEPLYWSAALHAAFFLILLVKTWVFPGNPQPYIPTLKVDLVALPDVLKKDLVPPAQQQQLNDDIKKAMKAADKAASKLPLADPHEMAIKPKSANKAKTDSKSEKESISKKNQRALDRLKALAKIQGEQEIHTQGPSVIKGNKLSPGTSLSGEAREAAEASYYDVVRDRLQAHWSLPPWIARQSLDAKVLVLINAQGRVQSFSIVKSSGNPQFDDAVKLAIQESQPFPAPPSDLVPSLSSKGILVGFPL